MKCNCESTLCPNHPQGGPCAGQTDSQNVMMYVGEVCNDCASHIPVTYMLKVDGNETMAARRDRRTRENMT